MKKLLLMLLACVGLVPVVSGQTGRIAHFNHGGSVGALIYATETEKDNFGNPYSDVFHVETITATSDTTAVMQGQEVYSFMGRPVKGSKPRPRTAWIHFGGRLGKDIVENSGASSYYCFCEVATRPAVARRLKRFHPEAKLIGFDSLATFSPQMIPADKSAEKKRKKSGATYWSPIKPLLPGGPSIAAVLLLTALAGAGWLLAGRRSTAAA